jgi:Zn-dependent M28 family amino/carboxypeptidase
MLAAGTLQSEKAFPWARSLEYANDPDYAWVGSDGQAFDDAPGIRVRGRLHGPAAETVFAGAPRTLADIRQEADREQARPRGFSLSTRATFHVTAAWERITSPNVVGRRPGADPVLAGQHTVLSAHLDHLGIKDVGTGGSDHIYNGALDNGAGVAALLEVARAASAARDRPRRSMLFIATTGEEKGLLGADYFARHPTVPIGQIVGDVDLDMPLLLYPFTDVIAFGANHSTIGPLVAKAAAPMNVKLSPDPMPEQGIFTRSDHYQFVRQGIPAVFLATGMASGGDKIWSEFLNGAYHSPRDDVTQNIDWEAGARVAEVNYRIAREMSDADERPLWFKGDYFGDTFAPGAARATR